MSTQTDKIESVIHRAVQKVLSEGLNDPRVRGLISVTKVSVTADLEQAMINVSIHPADAQELSLRGIRHATKHIRSCVASAVSMRRIPKLTFRLDDSIKKQSAIFKDIQSGVEYDEQHQAPDSPSSPEGAEESRS